MSFPPTFPPPVGPIGFVHDAARPPLAPTSSPLVHRYGHIHGIPAPAPAPVPAALPPAFAGPPHVTASSRPMEPLKLSPLKDEKAFLDNYDLIQYFLRVPEFSTGRPDDTLITDSSNADASRIWEGQLRLAVKDGSLKYLFDNKGDLYNGRGFEMLARSSNIAARTRSLMLSPLFCRFSTTCKALTSLSFSTGLDSMG